MIGQYLREGGNDDAPGTSQNPLEVLGTMLGLTAMAGIKLYLTVFVTGIAGVFYALEFFADKVPWVDSLWDSIHTFVRPIGTAFLAIKALGTTDPLLDVIAGLLGGSVALCAHTTKRLRRFGCGAFDARGWSSVRPQCRSRSSVRRSRTATGARVATVGVKHLLRQPVGELGQCLTRGSFLRISSIRSANRRSRAAAVSSRFTACVNLPTIR